ncbi:MAG: ankyrin repeat domain-containing protein [Candidatus Thiodiazotropha taylori]|uniref:Ankyrin repeat domain-containing protein n=1 Tax=Candidatus Thiodiazotropha taylori TaxID=2792791 RepID=A0A9E4N4T6_9GAMM|nr:ankyrin repeat domain-containing protein [Candidatus Thiodiazotropha taylori]MCW4256751.1 ankyrin repeat domain-containing protein [Candidatus Thiodiazotropha taylori]
MNLKSGLTSEELAELKDSFCDLASYESEDPLKPVDPLTWVAPDDDTALYVAAWRDDVRATELLIKAGVDVNALGDMSSTALHIATSKGNKKIQELLLNAGASTELVNEFGLRPLQTYDDIPRKSTLSPWKCDEKK